MNGSSKLIALSIMFSFCLVIENCAAMYKSKTSDITNDSTGDSTKDKGAGAKSVLQYDSKKDEYYYTRPPAPQGAPKKPKPIITRDKDGSVIVVYPKS